MNDVHFSIFKKPSKMQQRYLQQKLALSPKQKRPLAFFVPYQVFEIYTDLKL